jgi:hypothetical protein
MSVGLKQFIVSAGGLIPLSDPTYHQLPSSLPKKPVFEVEMMV